MSERGFFVAGTDSVASNAGNRMTPGGVNLSGSATMARGPVAAGLRSLNDGCGSRFPPHLSSMKQSDIFRENAENCLHLAERAEGQPTFKRYLRMAEAWTALAEEQDWLDGEIPPVAARVAQKKPST